MGGISEPIVLALIGGLVAIVTAFFAAARTARKDPTPDAPHGNVLSFDVTDRAALDRLGKSLDDLSRAVDDLRHELMRPRPPH